MRPALDARRRFPLVVIIVAASAIPCAAPSDAQPIEAIEHGLEIRLPGQATGETIDLAEALRTLHIPSVDVAVIDNGRVVWSRTFGGAPTNAIYQAASLSKLVTAVAALRLVDRGVLDLDRNVNDGLTAWRVPDNEWTRTRPVTLRGLLSMTAGIGVPGYLGYEPGAAVPTLRQILDGAPPANSEPVRVEALPGSRYGRRLRDRSSVDRSDDQDALPGRARATGAEAGSHAEQLLSSAAARRARAPCGHRP